MKTILKTLGIATIGLLSLVGCSKDKYPQETVTSGEIKVDLLNEIPHEENYFLRRHLGIYGSINRDDAAAGKLTAELGYSFRKNDISRGKYADKLTLGKTIDASTGYENFRQTVKVNFVDIGQDGIVDFTVREVIPHGSWEGAESITDTTDLEFDSNQVGVSRLYQGLVGRIN